MAEVLTKTQRIGFLQQADWATPSAASAAFETLNYDADSIVPDPSVVLNTFNVSSTTGLIPKRTRAYTDGTTRLKTLAFSGPAVRKNLAIHLVAALQKVVSEGATTPFAKVIQHVNDSAILDFTAGGYLFTIATDSNSSLTDGIILENAVLNNFVFTIDFNNEGIAKLANISGTWIGNEMNFGQDLTGSWVAESLANFYNDTAAFALAVQGIASLEDFCIRRYTLTINNNVEPDCITTKAGNYKFNNPTIVSTFEIPYDSSSKAILAAYPAGTEGSYVLEAGTPGAAGHLKFEAYGRINANPISTYNGYKAIALSLAHEFKASYFSTQVTISDEVDRTW